MKYFKSIYLLIVFTFALVLYSQVPKPGGSGGGSGSGSITGGTCTNQFTRAISAMGVPTCATVTSADVDGTIATKLTATSTINFTSINDGTCSSNTFTLSGALTTDYVAPLWPSGLETGLFGTMLVSASDTIQVRLCNLSGAAVDPASATFGAMVLR